MICSCCGYEIKGKICTVQNGEKHVCEKCWNDPNLFFPEKIEQDEKLKVLLRIATETREQMDSISVRAIKLSQKGTEMFIGKMKVSDILSLYELDKFKEEELEGYQRDLYEERTSELVEYLSECPLAIMPALLVSLREVEFDSKDGDSGFLKIPRRKGAIWIIDGQHRIGGFNKIREEFFFSKDMAPNLFADLMDYEFPIVFVDSATTKQKIKNEMISSTDFSEEDVERTIFFVVNKTQKGISPSLKDALLYRIKTSGIKGLPILEKESWRIVAAEVGISLNSEENSPLKNKINVSGRRKMGRPIQLNSFVSSLQTLFCEKEFLGLTTQDKLCFLKAYWSALRDLLPQAFEKKMDREFMLLKALAVYSLHCLAKDIFQECIKQNYNFRRTETLRPFLTPLKAFDWHVKTSPLSGLGGMKGVSKAYQMLVSTLKEGKELPQSKQALENRLSYHEIS